jgi:hypothetical protein
MKSGIMPSGITAAWGQQTAATNAKVGGARPARSKSSRARRVAPAGPIKRRRNGTAKRRAARAGGGRLRKGSAAAKKWGAKMRRLRKRR